MRKNRLAPETEKRLAGELAGEVLASFPSIHAFCKAHPELSRGTVYQALSGRYAGNFENQARKIRAALAKPVKMPQINDKPDMDSRSLGDALQDIRCRNCRRLNRRECMACRDQTAREAAELFEKLYGGFAQR